MEPIVSVTGDTLSDLFGYGARREDYWRSIQRAADTALRHPKEDSAERLLQWLRTLIPVESYWGFPGTRVLQQLVEVLEEGDLEAFDVAARNISAALHTKSYRRHPAAADVFEPRHTVADDDDDEEEEVSSRPYFEVLIVGGLDPDDHNGLARALQGLRDSSDDFRYECVTVESFQDAVVALSLNQEFQAMVALDGFPYHSTSELPHLEQFLSGRGVPRTGDLGLPLLNVVQDFLPHLDRYLLADRGWELIAGTSEAAAARRIFFGIEELRELHLSILDGVRERFQTPFFDNLKSYAQRPMGTYHALPIARGKSIMNSNWIRDMGEFYGRNIFLAESSATTGGLDSLLEPTGNIKKAQELAARAFGADHAYYATNGTSTSNKIVVQALCRPGDIVLIDRDCHKSHHYACVLAGAQPYYVDAFRLTEYSMYGGVPIDRIKAALLELKSEGLLDRVRMLILTNATFDGHMAHTLRTMSECLAIKPDLVFLWDEAWSAAASFSPYLRRRTAMGGAAALRRMQSSETYRSRYDTFAEQGIALDGSDPRAFTAELLPNPDEFHVRVYQTTSVHKSMSALRQASMILVADQYFGDVKEPFKEAFYTHTSTSPNQQIIATLDVARRQMELEGFELVSRALQLAVELRQLINENPTISRYFRALGAKEMIPPQYRKSGQEPGREDQPAWALTLAAIESDEFFLDLTRVTVMCGRAGMNGAEFKALLASDYEIQINKTSRNSVLFQININNTRGDVAQVIKVLADISRKLDDHLRSCSEEERAEFAARVVELVDDVPELPNFSRFHDAFRDDPASPTRHGHMREAFYLAYDPDNCEHLRLDSPELDERLANGPEVVGANFVIPYPPGFPVIVPGQVVTSEIVDFMRRLDVSEIHGYDAQRGLKLFTTEALARVAADREHRPSAATAAPNEDQTDT
ncbi:MAG: decarboxylase [Actinobacteria bacterium]|nr:decarboxylase [Actinomycetota bacterium]